MPPRFAVIKAKKSKATVRALQVPKLPAQLEARLQDDESVPSYRAPEPNDKIFQGFRQMLASVGAIEFQKQYTSNR